MVPRAKARATSNRQDRPHRLPQFNNFNMRATSLIFILSALAGGANADGSEESLSHAKCDRKTKNGDKVSVHYKGTLGGSGKKFDASKFSELSSNVKLGYSPLKLNIKFRL